jgi:hypothetical protein
VERSIGYFFHFKKSAQSKQPPNGRKLGQSGHPGRHPKVSVLRFCSPMTSRNFVTRTFQTATSLPGTNPTLVGSNAGVVEIYIATNSITRFRMKVMFPYFKNALAY